MDTDTLTPIPSTLPDVHHETFGTLTSNTPARLRTAIERVVKEAKETAGPGGISAFNSAI
jgi:hypothetical protein